MKSSNFLVAIVLVVVVGLLLNGCHPAAKIVTKNLSLVTLEGKPIAWETYKDKPVFLHFWATWCKDCWKEMPSLIAMHQNLGEKAQQMNFVFVSDEDPERIQAYLAEHALPFQIVRTSKSFAELGVRHIPQTFIYNSKNEQIATFAQHNWTAEEVEKWMEKK